MKKSLVKIGSIIMFSLFAILVALPVNAKGEKDDVIISFNQLPQKAQIFINTHFADYKLVSAKYDRDIMDKTYEVYLSDGVNIEFDNKGDLLEIECKNGKVPDVVVGEALLGKIQELYPGQTIVELKIEKRWTAVKLSNGDEVTLDKKMHVIDIDEVLRIK